MTNEMCFFVNNFFTAKFSLPNSWTKVTNLAHNNLQSYFTDCKYYSIKVFARSAEVSSLNDSKMCSYDLFVSIIYEAIAETTMKSCHDLFTCRSDVRVHEQTDQHNLIIMIKSDELSKHLTKGSLSECEKTNNFCITSRIPCLIFIS